MIGIWDGIVIGGAGGAVAGLTVWLVQLAHSAWKDHRDKDKVYAWLVQNTSNEPGSEFRSTRAIASWNNLTEDRVRFVCSHHQKIYLSTGENEDMWSVHGPAARSVYEARGLQSADI